MSIKTVKQKPLATFLEENSISTKKTVDWLDYLILEIVMPCIMTLRMALGYKRNFVQKWR